MSPILLSNWSQYFWLARFLSVFWYPGGRERQRYPYFWPDFPYLFTKDEFPSSQKVEKVPEIVRFSLSGEKWLYDKNARIVFLFRFVNKYLFRVMTTSSGSLCHLSRGTKKRCGLFRGKNILFLYLFLLGEILEITYSVYFSSISIIFID